MQEYLLMFVFGLLLFIAIYGSIKMLRQINRLKDEE